MILTNWGYTLTDLDVLPTILDEDEYDVFSAGKFTGDIRIEDEIRAACSSIRNYVGWHLYPPAACKLDAVMSDRRITYVGRDLLIQLPAKFVSEVTSVLINDKVFEKYHCETNGILHVYDVPFYEMERYTPITVCYIAGIPAEMLSGVKELVAHRVTHAEASSDGITSEAAGGVSVTYNANWVNSARATALPDDNKEVLAPYRVQGVF